MMPFLQCAGTSTRPDGRGGLADGSTRRGQGGDCSVCFGWGVHSLIVTFAFDNFVGEKFVVVVPWAWVVDGIRSHVLNPN
jgi:hypothetical protein